MSYGLPWLPEIISFGTFLIAASALWISACSYFMGFLQLNFLIYQISEKQEEYILLSFKAEFAQCIHLYTLLKKRQRTMHSVKLKTLLASIALAAAGAASLRRSCLTFPTMWPVEFYKDYNAAFIAHYKKTKGVDIKVDQSHGGSSAQARAVNDGLAADVVTFNTTTDVDFLASTGVVAKDWNKVRPRCIAHYIDHAVPGAQR